MVLDKYQKNLYKIAKQVKHLMGMDDWVLFFEAMKEHETAGDLPGWTRRFTVSTLWEYRKVNVLVNTAVLPFLTDQEIFEDIRHEFTHSLLAEMHEKGHKHEERVVSQFSVAFDRHILYGEKNVTRKNS